MLKTYNFFAFLARMKLIKRWSLMNNTIKENIAEHSLQVAMFAQMLIVLHNKYFAGKDTLNPETAAVIAMYHDVTEIITGDMPTPVKYFNPNITSTYKKIENLAARKVVRMLPDDQDIRFNVGKYLLVDNEESTPARMYKDYKPFIKAADKLSALCKCIEELRMGNTEFKRAKETIENSIKDMKMPEVEMFMEMFIPPFSLTLDELNQKGEKYYVIFL